MVLTQEAWEEVVIMRWLILCDALTFPMSLHVYVLPLQLPCQESRTRSIVFLFAGGAVKAHREAGTCLRVQSELKTHSENPASLDCVY